MNPICYLCGEEIVGETPSGDHSVPQQFIKRKQPKAKGFDYGGKLPTHAKCNNHFGPEIMCSKALQVLAAWKHKIYTNVENLNISIQVFKKEEIQTFTKKDLDFFGLVDTTNIDYDDWAHDNNFFKDKRRIIPLERPLNTALSVLTKSAAALLIKRFNISPKSYWNVLCIPYQVPNSINLDSIFGNTKPFEIGVKIWIKKFDNNLDYIACYKNEKVFSIIVFSFSQDKKYLKYCSNEFQEAERLLFESPKLIDLVNYNWLKNRIVKISEDAYLNK